MADTCAHVKIEVYLEELLVLGGSCGDHKCLPVRLGQLDCKVAHAASSSMHQHPPLPWLQPTRFQGLWTVNRLHKTRKLLKKGH